MSSSELSVQSAALVEWFPNDLEASLSGERVQFTALLDTDIGRQATSIASQPDATDDDIDVITTGEAVELRMYRLIRENTMQSCFPNVEMLLRMHLCLMVTNYTGERSFSKLRQIKECPANDDWSRTPKHADTDEYRERVATHD